MRKFRALTASFIFALLSLTFVMEASLAENQMETQDEFQVPHSQYESFMMDIEHIREIGKNLKPDFLVELTSFLQVLIDRYPKLNLEKIYLIKDLQSDKGASKVVYLQPLAMNLMVKHYKKKKKNNRKYIVLDSIAKSKKTIRKFISSKKRKRIGLVIQRKYKQLLEEAYENHFFPVYLEKSDDEKVHAVVTDSFDCGRGTSADLMRDILLKNEYSMQLIPYMLNIPRQCDDFTCPVFALKDLNRFSERYDLIDYLEKANNGIIIVDGVKYFSILPTENMQLTQSKRVLNAYLENVQVQDIPSGDITDLLSKMASFQREIGPNGAKVNAKAQLDFLKYLHIILANWAEVNSNAKNLKF